MVMGREDPGAVMTKVIAQVQRTQALHFTAVHRISFDIHIPGLEDVFRAGAHLGPVQIEGWYKSPRWRLELSYGPARGVRIAAGDPRVPHDYVFAHGKWARTKDCIALNPDELKLKVFGLPLAHTAVTYTSLTELEVPSAWVVRGVVGNGEEHTWWVEKSGLTVIKHEVKGGAFEFSRAGEKRQANFFGTKIMEFGVVELDCDIQDNLFETPSDAELAELEGALVSDLLERLGDIFSMTPGGKV